MPETTFDTLRIGGWRQFDQVDLRFHPSLTVLTGANGAGKSSLLNILTRHFGWERPYIGTPISDRKNGTLRYISGIIRILVGSGPDKPQARHQIGTIGYQSGAHAQIYVPRQVGQAYELDIQGQQEVPGLHIPSHRPLSHYQQVAQVPTSPMLPKAAYDHYANESRSRFTGGHTGHSPVFRLKEALIAMAMFGEGNSVVAPNQEILSVYRGFIDVLKEVLPPELGFIGIEIRMPEVVLVTKSGTWPIDAASGGVMSIIDMAWSIFLFSRQHRSFVVTMDEPENHLHPSMQRSLLRNFTTTFPNTQFVVATHSPFIVTSSPTANVYVLRFEGAKDLIREDGENPHSYDRRVRSVYLEKGARAGSANEILRDVLGVPATMPVWVEKELDQIIDRYRGRRIEEPLLADLRSELNRLGLDEYYADAVTGVVARP